MRRLEYTEQLSNVSIGRMRQLARLLSACCAQKRAAHVSAPAIRTFETALQSRYSGTGLLFTNRLCHRLLHVVVDRTKSIIFSVLYSLGSSRMRTMMHQWLKWLRLQAIITGMNRTKSLLERPM